MEIAKSNLECLMEHVQKKGVVKRWEKGVYKRKIRKGWIGMQMKRLSI